MISEPFRITVNDRLEIEAQPTDAQQLDVVVNEDGSFHILKDGKAFHAVLVEADYASRMFTFRINGNRITTKIADHYARLIQQMGLSVGGAQKVNVVKAPMPGLVLQVVATIGQEVQKGDTLLILEAMKMENVIKATGDGRVKSIAVQKGAAVEKGQLLIEFEG